MTASSRGGRAAQNMLSCESICPSHQSQLALVWGRQFSYLDTLAEAHVTDCENPLQLLPTFAQDAPLLQSCLDFQLDSTLPSPQP
jgi:hypothetical protein